MSYSLLQLGSDTRRRALSGLQQSAAREELREQANENLKQAERQQTMSAVGTGASIGMMAYGPVGAAVGAAAGFVIGELF
ncbi:bacteriocin [Vibrio navarrensis]|uniref:bacteriocin n=1 Tax=Vibrio navarrensis TaxID=29495 RepID=UPI0018667CB0|nr:bacteriocin [Vibrio navarrensis]MBE3662191.1 bacteriocin [Vibrio navarrensis]